MAAKLRNNVSTTLQASILSTDLTMTVPTGKGALWDDCVSPDYGYTTIMDTAGTVFEVVKVTARSGDSLTIARAQDGTSAVGWSAGSVVERRLNAAAIKESKVDSATAADSATSSSTAAEGTNSTAIATTAFVDRIRDVIGNTQSGSYTLALTDRGKSIDTSAGVTVPPNSTVAFGVGSTITVTNTSGASITVTQGSGVTLRLAGGASTGNRTLAQYGVCTMRKIATDTWVVSGAGLT